MFNLAQMEVGFVGKIGNGEGEKEANRQGYEKESEQYLSASFHSFEDRKKLCFIKCAVVGERIWP